MFMIVVTIIIKRELDRGGTKEEEKAEDKKEGEKEGLPKASYAILPPNR
jgi:hypothetical protein